MSSLQRTDSYKPRASAKIIEEAVEAEHGASDKADQTKRKKKGREPFHENEVLEKGQWLTIRAFRNRGGSWSFRITGQLPVLNSDPPECFRDILNKGKQPEPLRKNFASRIVARDWMLAVERLFGPASDNRRPCFSTLNDQDLRQHEHLHESFAAFLAENPDALEEAIFDYKQKHQNVIKDITLQSLVQEMAKERGREVSKGTVKAWRNAVNFLCRYYQACGFSTGRFDPAGREIFDMNLRAVTRRRLIDFAKSLRYETARNQISRLVAIFKFAKHEGYLRENIASEIHVPRDREEALAKAAKEIEIDSNRNVQIALNLAADFENGRFIPHVVSFYYLSLRPMCELRRFKAKDLRLAARSARLFSTKIALRRPIDIPENAAIMLEQYWDGRDLDFTGWGDFWKLVQAAQGYEVPIPKWLPVPPFEGSALFTPDDVLDPIGIIDRLAKRSDKMSAYLWGRMSPDAQSMLTGSGELRLKVNKAVDLVQGILNSVLEDRTIKEMVEVDWLRPTTKRLKGELDDAASPSGLNRQLLEDAYYPALRRKRRDPDNEIPRRTGASHRKWREPNFEMAGLQTGHDPVTFKRHYDGLVLKSETAQFNSLMPKGDHLRPEIQMAIRKDLESKQLLSPGDPFPSPPDVPTFDLTRPERKRWQPFISKLELRAMVRRFGYGGAAEELKTCPTWLKTVCRAMGISAKVPIEYRDAPDEAPFLPPIVEYSNEELVSLLKQHHGVKGLAKALGLGRNRLAAHCAVHGVKTPTQRELGLWRRALPRVNACPAQVRAWFKELTVSETAERAGVTVEHLAKYCAERGIKVPGDPEARPPSLPPVDLASIKTDILICTKQAKPGNASEALILALSKAPNGLTESELIEVLTEIGIVMAPSQLVDALFKARKRGLERYRGRIRLVEPADRQTDFLELKQALQSDIKRHSGPWTYYEAIQCVLKRARHGISLSELLVVLPWFGKRCYRTTLKEILRRLRKQRRLCFHWNVVTVPEVNPDWKTKRWATTPGLQETEEAAKADFAARVGEKVHVLEMMKMVLAKAPHGLLYREMSEILRNIGFKCARRTLYEVVCSSRNQFVREGPRLMLAPRNDNSRKMPAF